MKTTCKLAYLGSIAAALVASNAAVGGEISGRYTNVVVSTETIEVAKGHSVTFFVTRTSSVSDNFAPANALVGECGGYTVTMPGGKTSSSGICSRKGKDGDSESDTWSVEPGATRGTWKLLVGTGGIRRQKLLRLVRTHFGRRQDEYGKMGRQLPVIGSGASGR